MTDLASAILAAYVEYTICASGTLNETPASESARGTPTSTRPGSDLNSTDSSLGYLVRTRPRRDGAGLVIDSAPLCRRRRCENCDDAR